MFEPHSPLIVFDMDGTLFRTDSSFIPVIHEFVRRYSLPVPDRNFILHFCGEPIEVFVEWLKSLPIDRPTEELFAEFNALEHEYSISKGELYPGAIETLERLNADGYRIAICSNGTEDYLAMILDNFGLRRLVYQTAFAGKKGNTKSDLLERLLHDNYPDFAVMIGDRIHDLNAARENGIPFIAADYGYGDAELAGAEYRVNRIADIIPIISRLRNH